MDRIYEGIVSLLLIILLFHTFTYSQASPKPRDISIKIGDYAVYKYFFKKVGDRDRNPDEVGWVYVLMEADMLTRFTENLPSYYILNSSDVYFRWDVLDISNDGLYLRLNLTLINVLDNRFKPYNILNKSFIDDVFVSWDGNLYSIRTGGWVEDWLFWIQTSNLHEGVLKLFQPIPLVGGDYAVDLVYTSNYSFVKMVLNEMDSRSREVWGRGIRYDLRETSDKLYLHIGDSLITYFVVYPPPTDLHLNVLGKMLTGERLAIGGSEASKYVDISRVTVNGSREERFLSGFPTYFRLPRDSQGFREQLYIGINGFTYDVTLGVGTPQLVVYDALSGLLLYLKGISPSQYLPPSLIFKDHLNGHPYPGYTVYMKLVETSINLDRPIIGGFEEETSASTNTPSTSSNITVTNETMSTENETYTRNSTALNVSTTHNTENMSQTQDENSESTGTTITKEEIREPKDVYNGLMPYIAITTSLIVIYIVINYILKKSTFDPM